VGHVVGRDPLAAVGAQDGDGGVDADATRDVGDVDHELIHAHPADDRCLLPVDQHEAVVGQPAVEAVGIAGGHRGHGHGMGGRVRASVADRLVGLDDLDHRYHALPAQHRLDAVGQDVGVVRPQAVQDDPQPDHVVVIRAVAQPADGVHAVHIGHLHVGQPLGQPVEGADLFMGEGLGRGGVGIGDAQVGETARQLELGGILPDDLLAAIQVAGIQADAMHAGIDGELRLDTQALACDQGGIFLGQQGLGDAVVIDPAHLVGRGVPEDQYLALDARRPQRYGFVDRGHRIIHDPDLGQRPGHL